MNKLSDNTYNLGLGRSEPKLKLWSSAGLMLTYKCPASCEFCYYNSGPDKGGLMPVDMAIKAWQSLIDLAGERARVHITGGEPFLYFDHLLELAHQAQKLGLGGFDTVETNGFWATDRKVVLDRLGQLDKAGMGRLKVSWDPFHAEFIDIECVKTLVEAGREALGPDRILVRWEKYLEKDVELDPVRDTELGLDRDTELSLCRDVESAHIKDGQSSPVQDGDRDELYRLAAKDYPCRFTGRASGAIAGLFADKNVSFLCGNACNSEFLSAKGVHIDPFGNVFSGVCSGIVVGNIAETDLESIWRGFDPGRMEVIGELFRNGPTGLLSEVVGLGFDKKACYADKCHLCSKLRQFFFDNGRYKSIIGPPEYYRRV
jgi:MoaA/NifB/PqqE/SkfB family radical SAM enzyme